MGQVGEGDVVFAGLGETRKLAAGGAAALELIAVGVGVNVGIDDHADAMPNP